MMMTVKCKRRRRWYVVSCTRDDEQAQLRHSTLSNVSLERSTVSEEKRRVVRKTKMAVEDRQLVRCGARSIMSQSVSQSAESGTVAGLKKACCAAAQRVNGQRRLATGE